MKPNNDVAAFLRQATPPTCETAVRIKMAIERIFIWIGLPLAFWWGVWELLK